MGGSGKDGGGGSGGGPGRLPAGGGGKFIAKALAVTTVFLSQACGKRGSFLLRFKDRESYRYR